MKKITHVLLICFCIFGFVPKADALFEIFTAFTKRTRTINELLLEALSTPNASWKRLGMPFVGDYETSSTYIPSSVSPDHYNTWFEFAEKNHSKHPSIRTLTAFFEEDKAASQKITTEKHRIYEDRSQCFESHYVKTANQMLSDENSITYEITGLMKKREGTVKTSTDFMGATNKVRDFPETFSEKLVEYSLIWVVDLGNQNFRTYTYKSVETLPTAEEKKYLLDLFKYMEGKVQNVQS